MFTFKPPSVENKPLYTSCFAGAKRHGVMVRLHTLSSWLPKQLFRVTSEVTSSIHWWVNYSMYSRNPALIVTKRPLQCVFSLSKTYIVMFQNVDLLNWSFKSICNIDLHKYIDLTSIFEVDTIQTRMMQRIYSLVTYHTTNTIVYLYIIYETGKPTGLIFF